MITREQAAAGSPADKKKYMASQYLPHRNLNAVMSEVHTRMSPPGLSITIVVGPPGVGKTTFGSMRLRDILLAHRSTMLKNKRIIPAVMCEVDPADRGDFNFILLYNRISAALLAPTTLEGFSLADVRPGAVEATKHARLMMEKALVYRELQHLILDEAVHFTDSSTDPLEYGNLLKTLSNRANVNVLMLGAYGCERLVKASGQLGRRITVVHYERYKDTTDDFKEYCTYVKSVVKSLPYSFELAIENKLEYLFAGTFGLPGLTTDVLKVAAKLCFESRQRVWEDGYLLKAMPSKAAQATIARETVVGESQVQPFLQSEHEVEYATAEDIRQALLLDKSQSDKLNGVRPS